MRFFLGTHKPHWLGKTDMPLFVSHRALRTYKTMPRALGPWALDSGGFTELSMHGRWVTSTSEYVEAVTRYADEVGGLEWAAPQDWMCEPHMIERTGLSVREHQERTVANFLAIDQLGPFIPVVQGWDADEYIACVELYADAGVDLRERELVGVGTVCRRQDMAIARDIFRELRGAGLTVHGFGVKMTGLRAYWHLLDSSDSMAWSYSARRQPPMEGHTHKACNNCIDFATAWRGRMLDSLGPIQPTFEEAI